MLQLPERPSESFLTLFRRQTRRACSGFTRDVHTHVEGSGVGLYIVKRMVENASGSIWVRSQPGVGSVFTVALPAGRA